MPPTSPRPPYLPPPPLRPRAFGGKGAEGMKKEIPSSRKSLAVNFNSVGEIKQMKTRFTTVVIALVTMVTSFSTHSVLAQEAKEITNSIGMKLVLIPKGTFTMGEPIQGGTFKMGQEQLEHEVTISKDYYLGVYEVTQAQYEKVMGENPSYFQGDKAAERHPQTGRIVKDGDGSNHPVERVSWYDAVKFCQRLSELPEEKKAGRVYRLPTEAEWEYACRAGSKTYYSFGDNPESLGDYAWFGENSNGQTHPVGKKKPNAWGLYDMHGNVWEWCSDRYSGRYPTGAVTDPVGPKEGSARVNRGGSWGGGAALCRSAHRHCSSPAFRIADHPPYSHYGFRLALSPSGIPK